MDNTVHVPRWAIHRRLYDWMLHWANTPYGVPALVLHAPDDTLVAFEQGTFAADHIPGAQFVPMERGGHLALMMDINAEAREKVLQFLENHSNW